jgi:hypothetical protein
MAVVGAAPCPMLLAGRSPDRVAGAHRAARDLHPTDARDDVSVWPIGPGGARARLERHQRRRQPRR